MKKSIYYGYTRVSTTQQNTMRQEQALLQFGVPAENIYSDQRSGKDFHRENYQALRKKLRTNDVLVIQSLDRLGRNYEEIQEQWRHITKTIQAHMVVLDMPLLDTRQEKDLMGVVISDIVLQLLSYVAQTEREFLRQRQAEGIAVAKAQGKHLGRPRSPYPPGFEEAFLQVTQGQIRISQAARSLGLTPSAMRWFIARKQSDLDNI